MLECGDTTVVYRVPWGNDAVRPEFTEIKTKDARKFSRVSSFHSKKKAILDDKAIRVDPFQRNVERLSLRGSPKSDPIDGNDAV